MLNQRIAGGKLSQMTGKLADAINEQDLGLHLSLAAIATSKAQRAVQLEALLTRFSDALVEKLTLEYLGSLAPETLIELQNKIAESVTVDTTFVKNLLAMKAGGESTFFLRIVEILRGTVKGAKQLRSAEGQAAHLLQIEGHVGGAPNENFTRLVQSIALRVHHDGPESGSGRSEPLALAPGSESPAGG